MKIKVLMVCLGNICRSPLAEGILQSKVNLETVHVSSAGTAGYHIGSPPDRRSISVARKYQIDISAQRCRQFQKSDFEQFDLIFAMDRSNLEDILRLAENELQKGKVKLLLSESNDDLDEVPDPYYGGSDGFEYVYHLIDEACEILAKRLSH